MAMQGLISFKNIKTNHFYQFIVDVNGIRFHYVMLTTKYLVESGKASPSLLDGDLSRGMEITHWSLTRETDDGTLLKILDERTLPVDFDMESIQSEKRKIINSTEGISDDMLSKCMESVNEIKLEAVIKAFETYITDNF